MKTTGLAAIAAAGWALSLSAAGLPAQAAPAPARTAAAAASDPKAPALCDRACLEATLDSYIAALVAHDPSRLPLAKQVKYTEMGQQMPIGDGIWGTISGVGRYRHVFADPESGQIALLGTLHEGPDKHLMLMSLRLRVQFGKITEIETAFYRKGSGPAWNDAGLDALEADGKPPAAWLQTAPPAQRLSRQQLIATANAYFSALERNDGHGYYPFTDDCNRIENGVSTTNNPSMKEAAPGFNPMAMGCKAQFKTGYYGIVTHIHDRRFPIVDEAHQVVFALAVFDHNGTVPAITTPEGRVAPMAMFNKPSSILISEAFLIAPPGPGRIHLVEALGASVPYHLHPGWEGGVDSAWPSPPQGGESLFFLAYSRSRLSR
jgi:hypothetical protein